MAGFKCPFCNQTMAVSLNTHSSRMVDFRNAFGTGSSIEHYPYLIKVEIFKCPNCNEESILVKGVGKKVEGITRWINPISTAIQYPDYIPEQIRADYEEASAIADLSPKAAATLARRCLQGMIRDFWDIKDKKNLAQEIEAISEKVSPSTKKALNDLRELGNIGAHMEKDVDLIIDIDPGEAKTLLRFIEHLMKEWYITRFETEELLTEISNINIEKQQIAKGE